MIRTTLAIPNGVVSWAIGGKAITYRGQTLHPRIQIGLAMMNRMGMPKLNELTPDEAREQSNSYYDLLDVPKKRMALIEDKTIDGPLGPIPVRIYRPKKLATPAPVLIFYHGGGFVIGDIDGYDHPTRKLAKIGQCAVIAVDYRLAPEHKFPAGFNDCWAVFNWVRTHGSTWGLDTTQLSVCGDSAGGNITAAVSQRARDEGGQQPNLQVLLYPRVDAANETLSGKDLKSLDLLLTDDLMTWFKNHTISKPEDVYDVRMSPLLHDNFSDLPPTLIATCGFDPLWDEGVAYAQRLKASGVEVEHIHLPDMIHGVWSSGGFFKGVKRLQKRVALQVRAAHQGRLRLSSTPREM